MRTIHSTIYTFNNKFFFSQLNRFAIVLVPSTIFWLSNLYLLYIWLYSTSWCIYHRLSQNPTIYLFNRMYKVLPRKGLWCRFFSRIVSFSHFHHAYELYICQCASTMCGTAFAVIYTTIHKHQAKSLHRAYIWACPNKTE